MYNTTAHNTTKRWVANYLSGRQAHVHYNGKTSHTRIIPNGVPQGSVLSPTLFNLYMHDLPSPPPNVQIASYADDVTITSTHHKAAVCSTQVQPYINTLEDWLTTNRLKVAPSKSTSTLLTNDTHEHKHKPTVTLNNTLIPHTDNTKILGVTYNTSMTFTLHITNITNKCTGRLNALRALTGTDFGQHKETTTLIYKQYIRSVLDYASPAWAPSASQTAHKKLQTIQNSALRIITGCTQTTPIEHLHAETKVLKLHEHLDMRGTQFLATAVHNPNHPCHYMHNKLPTPRHIKNTPHKHYSNILTSLSPPDNPQNYTKHIHTHLTRRALQSRGPNTLLGHPPPDIDKTETQLSRHHRVHLSRLRCGHHPSLHTYKHRLDATHSDTCPHCQAAPHTTTHIMEDCTAWAVHRQHHNIHNTTQLWSGPCRSAAFLRDAGFLQ